MIRDILEFIFQDGLHFWGTVLLLIIIFNNPLVSVRSVRMNKDEDKK